MKKVLPKLSAYQIWWVEFAPEKGIATKGGFKLQIQFTDTSQAVTKAKVELTPINKGGTKFEQEYDVFTVSDENNEIKTLQCNGEILPNQYRLEISFINEAGSTFSTWQDIIHIEPGRITEDKINISAGEIVTPRVDICAVDIEADRQEVLEMFLQL